MKLDDLKGKHIVIFGLGVEGKAALEVLQAEFVDAKIDVIDEGTPENSTITADELIEVADENMVIVRSPGVPFHHELLETCAQKGVTLTSGVNIFFAQRKGRGTIIGITGSKGKSTTASLLAHILTSARKSVQLIGNIGEPAIKHLDDADETIFVVELSSYQLEDFKIGPDIAIILNLFVAHVEHHKGEENYWAAKMRIATVLDSDDLLIYNDEFDRLNDLVKKIEARSIPFPHDVDDEIRAELQLPGEHFVENARSVIAVCRELGIDEELVFSSMKTFKGLEHRLEDAGTFKGITFINDSIATLPDASVAAINAFSDNLGAIILGGQDEGYDFTGLAERLSKLKDVIIYALPGGTRIKEMLDQKGVKYQSIETVEDCVKSAYQNLVEGRVCLLSPASPSFDQFENYQERGRLFKEWVEKYGK